MKTFLSLYVLLLQPENQTLESCRQRVFSLQCLQKDTVTWSNARASFAFVIASICFGKTLILI